jgi:NitT/TauT family transport system ATP-binding protein
MSSVCVQVVGLEFKFGESLIVSVERLVLERAQCHVFLAPSGSGKTTFLRLLAGLFEPSRGSVEIFGRKVNGVSPQVGMLFQDVDAFPWLTVRDNIARLPGVKVDELTIRRNLESVGLSSAEAKYPFQLSGGMKKRLAFARTIAAGKQVYLMDEPFNSLDILSRVGMWTILKELIISRGITPLLVTHDIEEAVELGDQIHIFDGPPLRLRQSIAVEENGITPGSLIAAVRAAWT